MNEYKNKLIIFSAPSGSGKTTIVKHLLKKYSEKIAFSISASTRSAREGEVHGKDYYFISQEEFLHRIAQHEFVEFEEVYKGTYYGTLRSEIERIWSEGKQVIFDLDVEGGLHLKKKFGDQALAVFVHPGSIENIEKRLRYRATESEEKLKQRIDKAAVEMEYSDKFDVVLINENLSDALAEAENLLESFLQN